MLRAEGAVITFFVSRDGVFVLLQLRCDVLESSQGIDDTDTEFLSNGALKLRCDEGFNENRTAAVGVCDDALVDKGFGAVPGHQ